MSEHGVSRRALMKLAAYGLADSAFGVKGDGLNAGGAVADAARIANKVAVTDLRCEYRMNPLGIDEQSPLLSWVVQTGARAWKQSAYQVVVASSKDTVSPGKADLWDSGKVWSDQTTQVPYRGRELRSRHLCWWRVRVWDGLETASEWSPVAYWTMGLLSEPDWQNSRWIGRDDILENTERVWDFYEDFTEGKKPLSGLLALPASKPAPFLRREFIVSGLVRSAHLFASGLGYANCT